MALGAKCMLAFGPYPDVGFAAWFAAIIWGLILGIEVCVRLGLVWTS